MSVGFRCQSYVCILRWKRGEKAALKELYAHDRLRITPLLELPDPNSAGDPPPNGKQGTMREIAEEVDECWGDGFAFFDLRVLDAPHLPGTVHPVEEFFTAAAEQGLSLVPVTSLGRSLSYQQAVGSVIAADQRGVCVRLSRGDLATPSLEKVLDAHLMRLGVRTQETDLLVDLEIVDEAGYDLVEICARLPYLLEWRTFVVAGGAFPKDLQDLEEGSNFLPR